MNVEEDGKKYNRTPLICICFIIMIVSSALTVVAMVYVPDRADHRILLACQASVDYLQGVVDEYATLDILIEEAA